MKDKLVKTGHKRFFYRLQTTLVAFAFVLVVGLFAAIPIAITYRLAVTNAAAEETSEKTPETPESSSSTNEESANQMADNLLVYPF
jgi:hypothetical protein